MPPPEFDCSEHLIAQARPRSWDSNSATRSASLLYLPLQGNYATPVLAALASHSDAASCLENPINSCAHVVNAVSGSYFVGPFQEVAS